jgi:hypothetical protein
MPEQIQLTVIITRYTGPYLDKTKTKKYYYYRVYLDNNTSTTVAVHKLPKNMRLKVTTRCKPVHGTRAMYIADCRCSLCIEANNNYQRDYRARRKAEAKS